VLAHPDATQLMAFGLGQLDEAESAAVESHLADCTACRSVVESAADDSVVALLRSAAQPDAGAAQNRTEGLRSPEAPAIPGVPVALVDHPRYRVQELLGVGGMGAVYRAEHQLMARPVALKVLNKALTDSPAGVERFRREAQAAARLAHPNIVAAYDAEQAGDSHFLVMEYVEGTSLARLVADKGPLPLAQACDYVRQAALGLQYAYEQGMVHRDIKPHNLMLTPDGRVKILDFGLARFAVESAPAAAPTVVGSASDTPTGPLTQLGTVMGTPDYIAPEQAADAHAADIRADVYSLGCTLYDLLAGRPPFPEGTAVQKVMAHAQRQPRPLGELRKDVPPALARVVERMMAKDPARRYQTPAEAARALAPFAGGATRRRPWLLYAAGAALCLVILGMMVERLVVYLHQRYGTHGYVFDQPGPGPTDRIRLDPGVPPPDSSRGVTSRWKPTDEIRLVPRDLPGEAWRPLIQQSERAPQADKESPETLRKEGEKLQGTWVVVSSVDKNGKPDGGTGDKLIFTGDRFATSGLNDDDLKGTYSLFRHANAKAMDLIVTEGPLQGDPLRALYVLEGDELHIGLQELAGPPWKSPSNPCARGLVRALRRETSPPGQVRCLTGYLEQVWSVAVSADGRRAIAGSSDKTVRLWDLDTGQELKRFTGHTERVEAVALSPDGRRALSGGADRTMRLWDVGSGQELHRFDVEGSVVFSVAFSPDGRRALSGDESHALRLWDLETGKEVRHFEGHTWWVYRVAFSPDGKRALSGSPDGTVRLWDVDTGAELRRFRDSKGHVWSVAFSPDGRRVLAGYGGDWLKGTWMPGQENSIRVWDADSGEELARLTGHTDGVMSLAVSPDGRQALSAGADNTVRLWDVGSGKELHCFPGHTLRVMSVAFTPDGRHALSGGWDGTVRLWELPEPELSPRP
jgi:uncharacterized protein (TIGR03067 family)